MLNTCIYLDYNATTPCDPQVVEEMLPYFGKWYGNAGNIHYALGWKSKQAVEESRERIAHLLGAQPHEIIFTSGATESINLALRGLWQMRPSNKNHIISAPTEHKATLDTLHFLSTIGAKVTFLPVNEQGLIHLEDIQKAIREETLLINLMHGNNETGVLFPLQEIAALAKAKDILMMSDITQTFGKIPMDCRKTPLDILTFSAHKIYGPKGVGGLYIRSSRKLKLAAQITGGGQEKGLRSGTLNVPGIVGFGVAAELSYTHWQENLYEHLAQYRDLLEHTLSAYPIRINGKQAARLPHVSNISFLQQDGKKLLQHLSAFMAVSSVSACNASDLASSHVLRSMHISDKEAQASLRFSLGKWTKKEEIIEVGERIKNYLQAQFKTFH